MKLSKRNSVVPIAYSNGILLGNWQEERVGRYKKNYYKHISVYAQDFTPKTLSEKKSTDEIKYNIRTKQEYADNISPSRITNKGENYYDNFTTTYDLCYQYFPQWIKGTLNRKLRFRMLKYEPADEYLNGYGNLSSRNTLTINKIEEWRCEVLDPRRPVLSVTKSDFTDYNLIAYQQKLWPRLHGVYIQCGKAKEMVYMQLPENHPRALEAKVNPITWEGHSKNLSNETCVCKSRVKINPSSK